MSLFDYRLMILNIILSLFCMACHTQTLVNNKSTMEFKPKFFGDVKVNINESGSYSPDRLPPGETGIRIRTPKMVSFSLNDDNKFIPLCGYYKLKVDSLLKNPGALIIYVRNLETDIPISGLMVDRDSSPVAPSPKKNKVLSIPSDTPIQKTDSSKSARGGYFNPDLLTYVNFPLISGHYEVYVEYGGVESNKEVIELKVKL